MDYLATARNKMTKITGKTITRIPERVLDEYTACGRPGVVRELEHGIERAIITNDATNIRSDYNYS